MKDIRPGAYGSTPYELTAVGTKIFFSADDGAAGRELWASDGTDAGTVRVADIAAGSDDSYPTELTAVGSTLFFSADTAGAGRELWRSTGVGGTTDLVRDIRPGSVASNPRELTADAAEACDRLLRAGIPLGNQSVLLRGVNDDAKTMQDLCEGLVRMRVRPYYCYQAQLLEGTAHFRVPIEDGIELFRGMRGRTYTVGVLVVELRNPFLPDVIDSINATLGAAGYKALIGVGQSRAALESAMVESMIAHGMDGLVLIAPRLPPDVIRGFARVIPIVLVGHHLRGETGFDTVNTDDALGAELAVRELISLGHRRIGMLSLADRGEGEVSMQRELGYRRAMAAAGLLEGGILRLPRGGVRCPDELSAWAAGRLTPYKRPTAIQVVDGLPRTPSGKLLRRRLRDGLAVPSLADPS